MVWRVPSSSSHALTATWAARPNVKAGFAYLAPEVMIPIVGTLALAVWMKGTVVSATHINI